MWQRKELKKSAKGALRANYWRCVVVSLLVLALAGGVASVGRLRGGSAVSADPNPPDATNSDIVNTLVRETTGWELFVMDEVTRGSGATQGVLATVFNNATASGSYIFGVLNGLNQLIFNDRIMPGVTILIGVVLSLAVWLFFECIIQVGQCRFFLENRLYPESRATRIFFVYRIWRAGRVAAATALRTLYLSLWWLTIAGGFVKTYSYRMVPYILAENPDLSPRQVITLSRRMMKGQKWRTFLLDLSFLGWILLSIPTLGILYILYVAPYISATDAELYMRLRSGALSGDGTLSADFNDRWLAETPEPGVAEYPSALYPIPERVTRSLIATDPHRSYSFTDLLFLFFVFSMIGYVYEVVYFIFTTGEITNRGTMYGPWLPIYGVGGALTLLALRRWVDKPLAVFFLSMALCGTLEYATAWLLETFFHTKWWDYTGFFLNIQGRVCLEGLIVFGLACSLGIYILSPSIADLFDRFSLKTRRITCAVLSAAFVTDFVFSLLHPNMAAGIHA